MSVAVVGATALLLAVSGAVAAPWAAALAGAELSSWTGRLPLAVLAGLGGAGAAAVATSPAELLGLAALALGCAVLVAVDLACHRLPDVVTLPTAVALLAGLAAAAALDAGWPRLGGAVLGGAAVGAGFLLLALASPRAIGLGDVKLGALLGLLLGWFGWDAVLAGVVAAFVVGGAAAIVLLVSGRATRRTPLAFGPCLVLGAAAGVALVTSGGLTP